MTKAELLRTIKAILLQGDQRFSIQCNYVRTLIKHAIENTANLKVPAIRAIFGLLPEMAPQKISAGSPCLDLDNGKKFTCLGYFRNSVARTHMNPSSFDADLKLIKGFDRTMDSD